MKTCVKRLAVLLVILSAPFLQAENHWRAGVARNVITPDQPMWMSGYASRNHPAEGALHDLWAKVLVVEDPAGHELVLISLDLVGIDRPMSQQICKRIQQTHGILHLP